MNKHTSFETKVLTNGLDFDIPSSFLFASNISTDSSRWDITRFQTPNLPCVISAARKDLAMIKHRILDCPIRFPGSNIRLPNEILPLIPEIMDIFEYEAAHNAHFDEYYAYLATDYGFIKAGEIQRKPGCHEI